MVRYFEVRADLAGEIGARIGGAPTLPDLSRGDGS
jgi:hypothetical protein